jgi:hypothetical protein
MTVFLGTYNKQIKKNSSISNRSFNLSKIPKLCYDTVIYILTVSKNCLFFALGMKQTIS